MINTIYRNIPSFIHAPGKAEFNPLWGHIVTASQYFGSPTNWYPNISIITWKSAKTITRKSQEHKVPNILSKSLKKSRINHTVLKHGQWQSNRIKIRLTYDYLTQCNTDYVMGCDNDDVIFVGDNADPIDILKYYNCRLLFNAEKQCWPADKYGMKSWQSRLTKPPFQFFNAGLWVGERDYCIEFFGKALAHINDSKYPWSEQICLLPVYRRSYPDVKIDDECRIFLCINRVTDAEAIVGMML